jgi:Fic family protein
MFGEKVAISVYQQVKNTTQGIRPPQSLTVIRRGDSQFRSGEIVYTPPRGEGIIEQKLRNLFDFLNTPNEFDPLLKMVIGHYQFEAIHPFSDGNGRTGRILNVLYLIQQELLGLPVLYLSHYIIQNKSDYYRLLKSITEENNWEEWILFVVNGVAETSKMTLQKINAILEQKASAQIKVKEVLKSSYSKELVDLLFSHPYIKIKVLEDNNIAKRQTASEYLQKLEKAGMLVSMKIGKETYYINHKLIDVLSK